METQRKHTYQVRITGLVQGVGFRPFIYRLAHEHQLKGWVKNTSAGVELRVNTKGDGIQTFLDRIPATAPPASFLDHIAVEQIAYEAFDDFHILESEASASDITLVSPDISVCQDCLDDLQRQVHRKNYPFINCTNCGPRFSIIQALPYDRPNTTMAGFEICSNCKAEYTHILDRRFHAQPVACNSCGPSYSLIRDGRVYTEFRETLEKTAEILEQGGIVAIKGVGGYHLMCDALNEDTVDRLRRVKLREGKPFAVLFRNEQVLEEHASFTPAEKKWISSWERPILILQGKGKLAPAVANGFSTIGAMLPYTPLHYLLFEKTRLHALVLTSGNLSDEPIVIENEKALGILGPISDACLIYNRDIHNRADDSVLHVVNEKPRLIRRSRGFAPAPVRVKQRVEGIVALGAELSNCFAVGRKDLVFLSQHIGDLRNYETYEFFLESLARFKKLFRVETQLLAADLHPDYLSTQYALQTGLHLMRIQHHHAHLAACMAEHRLDEPTIGVAFDGTGMGDDGSIWGGEFLLCDYTGYRRMYHLPAIPLPGGDKVTKEPWRTAVSLLFQEYGNDFLKLNLPFLQRIDANRLQLVVSALEKEINVPVSTGAGRWFDAVAALTGLCLETSFHAEAPMRLEDCIQPDLRVEYPFEISQGKLVMMNTLGAMVKDILDRRSVSYIATGFHNTMVNLVVETCKRMAEETGVRTVVLSGGSFQNRYLLSKLEQLLPEHGLHVYSPALIPANDGGLALGQMVIAAARRQ